MVLKINNLSKSFPSPSSGYVKVLDDIDLTLAAAQSMAIVGPSGSGKSTLLNIIGGLDAADSGDVIINGQSLSKASQKQLAEIRNRMIGFVFQQHHLLPQCTALENVLVPTLAFGKSTSDSHARAMTLLSRVGLSDRIHHRPGQLSVGQCQRVAIARALINQPVLLLADEPTGSLDAQNRAAIMDLLLQLQSQDGVALLVATHSLEVAALMADTMTLRSGKLAREQGQ